MYLTDLMTKDFIIHQFTARSITVLELQANDIGVLAKDMQENDYKLTINEKVTSIQIEDVLSKQTLDFQLYRNNANLAQVMWVKDNLFELKIFFFSGEVIRFPELEIGITDKAMSYAKKRKMPNIRALSESLERDCILTVNGETYVCARITAQEPKEADEQDDNKQNDGSFEDDVNHFIDSITIYGNNYRLPIVKKALLNGIDDSHKLLLSSIQPNKKKDNVNYQLIQVKLSWVEESESKAISDYAKNKLDTLIADNSSYFKVWEQYVQKEMEFLLKKVNEIGIIVVLATEPCKNGLRIYVDRDFGKILKSGENGDTLEILEQESLELNNDDELILPSPTPEKLAKVLLVEQNYIEIDNTTIQKGNILKLSIYGDIIQVERRQKARERILNGRSANPNLGLIIEGADGIPIPKKPLRPITLNPEIEQKIFNKDGATPTQKRAVELALNTPDIMLIQGPPGTGKTTVITAILEQLNLIQDKKSDIVGSVLISAFQHDAVDNLSGRLIVNDIPIIKFSSNDEHKYRNLERIHQWTSEISHHIDEQQPKFDDLLEIKLIEDLAYTYKKSPSRQQAVKLLVKIRECSSFHLGKENEQKINHILRELATNNLTNEEQEGLKLVRSIRITESGYSDDGMIILQKIEEQFSDVLSDKNLALLNSIINGTLSIDEIISYSKTIKKELMDALRPQPIFSASKPRKDILQLLDAVQMIVNKQRQYIDKKEQILFDFKSELLNNPYGVAKSLERYNAIYASTVQQSDGKQIRHAKKAYNKSDEVSYDTVIIDEAARVGAMDLLIPMSQAKNRIILVGDHRQLPHMIEDELVYEVEKNEDFDDVMVQNYLKNSIFEYLFSLLKKMEKKDGIIRTITLDAQYRSHPLLGRFASDCFYQPYNESYDSPTKAEEFKHQLSGIENKAAIWLNVPHHIREQRESKKGTSRYRELEVDKIVERLLVWLNSNEGQTLTFGVISFYSAQVALIKEKLMQKGIDLNEINREKERLRIGSVDAFQGMEFDIVFLSMVRTKSVDEFNKMNADDRKMQTRTFGHLMSKNRLCVAVTRQKRALILVGNAEMVLSEIGQNAVPELTKFYELCMTNEQGIVL